MIARAFQVQILLFLAFGGALSAQAQMETAAVCVKNTCVTAEVASTEYDRAKGLMHRETLPYDRAMLFVFDKAARYSFWMMNMRISIDMIWIGDDNKIVDITKNVQPCAADCESVKPSSAALYVLETAAGFADKFGIKTGDRVSIKR